MNSYNEIISAESVMLYLIKDNFNLKVKKGPPPQKTAKEPKFFHFI